MVILLDKPDGVNNAIAAKSFQTFFRFERVPTFSPVYPRWGYSQLADCPNEWSHLAMLSTSFLNPGQPFQSRRGDQYASGL